MNLQDVATVLAKCVAYDNRTTTDATVLAWHEALDDMPLQDALNAVRDHYATSREWIMPSDLNQAYHALKRARLNAIPQARRPLPPQDSTPEENLIFHRAVLKAIADGMDAAGAAQAGNQAIGYTPQIEQTQTHEIPTSQIGKPL